MGAEEGLPAWLVVDKGPEDGSTVGVAWGLLRKGWQQRGNGNKLFAGDELEAARAAYLGAETSVARGLGLVSLDALAKSDRHEDERFRGAADALRRPLAANLSLVCLRLGDANGAKRHATACLAIEPRNVKALYRRGLASIELLDAAAAEADLRAALSVNPSSRDVHAALVKCRQLAQSQIEGKRQSAGELAGAEISSSKPLVSSSSPMSLMQEPQPNGLERVPTPTLQALSKKLWSQLCVGTLEPKLRQAVVATAQDHGGAALLMSTAPAHESELRPGARADDHVLAGVATPSAFSNIPEGTILLIALCSAPCGGKQEQLAADLLKCLAASEAGALISWKDPRGRTPLHIAAAGGATLATEALLDVGADTELIDEDERTPLHLAAIAGHAPVVALLLEIGCVVDVQDQNRRTALFYAGVQDHKDIAALLVDKGKADQSILFHALKEKFGTHNFLLHDWPEYNGRWMTSKEGRLPDVPLRAPDLMPFGPT